MRGITSQAMVMCSSTEDGKTFELLDAPDGSVAGDRVTFEGYPGDPDNQLNPKKKVDTAIGLLDSVNGWYFAKHFRPFLAEFQLLRVVGTKPGLP